MADPGPSPATHPQLRRLPPAGDWRGDGRAVVVLTFDVDAETGVLAEGDHYAGDLSTMSHQAYGPRVGVPRILSLLDEYELKATFFVPGQTAERWPDALRSIVDAGHEVGCHGHSHRRLTQMTEVEQRRDLEAALSALERIGIRPRGYRAPYWQLTEETLRLLCEHGFEYDSSLMDDDRPYRLLVGDGLLAELPVHWSLDDWEQYAYLPDPEIGHQIEAPAKVVELWTTELDAMRRTGSLYVMTCHPFISGRPSRIEAIARFIEFARECGDVGFSSTGLIVDAVLDISA
jgi:peptidoglycan-N-acetylglucosamine deacetylase